MIVLAIFAPALFFFGLTMVCCWLAFSAERDPDPEREQGASIFWLGTIALAAITTILALMGLIVLWL